MFKSQLWWLLLVLCSFSFKHPHRNKDWSPCTNCSSLLQNRPLPPAFCLLCYFLFHPSHFAPPQLIPSLRGEILAVSPLGFLLYFSRWALELFLAWGASTVNPPGIQQVGWGWQHFPAHSSQLSLANISSYSCRAPQSASRTLDLLQKVQLKTPRNIQSPVQHNNLTFLSISVFLCVFQLEKLNDFCLVTLVTQLSSKETLWGGWLVVACPASPQLLQQINCIL